MRPLAFIFALLLQATSVWAQAQTAQDADRLFARGLELHQAGDILGAIDAYKAALAIAPTRADALSNLGAAYVRLGQYDDAIKQYEAALQADALNNADGPARSVPGLGPPAVPSSTSRIAGACARGSAATSATATTKTATHRQNTPGF